MPDLPWFLAVAAAACVAALSIYGVVRHRRRRRLQAWRFTHAPAAAVPSEAERARALATGLIPAVQMRMYIDSLATGLPHARVTAILAEQWGVRTPGDLRATLLWLLQQGDRGTYRQVVRIATVLPPALWPEAIREMGEDLDHEQLHAWTANLAQGLHELRRAGLVRDPAEPARGIAAWDIARAILLARLGHEASLITTGQAWQVIEQASVHLYEAHASWREAAAGYLLGQAMHAGSGPVLEAACDAAQACLNDSGSPWRRQAFAGRTRRAPTGRVFDQPAHPPAA